MKSKFSYALPAALIAASLIAAVRLTGGTPVGQTFSYQGQLRSAGQLLSGPVDLRITLWDAADGGSQVGPVNQFESMQLVDGRFACGLNFGGSAFDGANRWIQVEFRNPAGIGQYLALNPRDKIAATPYALYALNGANGVWVYDTNEQSVSVIGKRVGIGAANPTAMLEVASPTGGDDSVKLPAASIGNSELALSARVRAWTLSPVPVRFESQTAGLLVLNGSAWNEQPAITVDGVQHTFTALASGISSIGKVVPLGPGTHTVSTSTQPFDAINATAIWVPVDTGQ
jgi:hypothetical protein